MIWPVDEGSTQRKAMVTAYEALAAQYKTCEFIESIGSGIIHPSLADLVELHDTTCGVNSDLPLEPLADSEINYPSAEHIKLFDKAFRARGAAQPTPGLLWELLSDKATEMIKGLDTQRARQASERAQAAEAQQQPAANDVSPHLAQQSERSNMEHAR